MRDMQNDAFAAGSNSSAPSGFRFNRGRKFSAGEVHLMVLGLLAERPHYGYELIKAFASLSHGFYSPSPGVLYPALGHLEELGHASVQVHGKRKLYELSTVGRAHLQANQGRIEQLFSILR